MAALASCSKEQAATVPAPDGTQTAIVPSAGLSISATPSVRAALPGGPVTAFPESTEDLFAVTAYKGTAAPTGDYGSAYFDNEAVDSDADGKLSFTNKQYYPADAEKLYFYAYSPVSTGYTAGTASAAPTVAWTIDGTQDIMYASAVDGIGKVSAGTDQPQPKFTFNHLLKQVRFKLVKGEGFGDGIYASSVKITNCRTQASLNLITGSLTFKGYADQSIGLSGNYAIQMAENAAEIGCVLCQAGETDLDIEIEAAGVTYKTSVTLTSSSTDITAGGAGVSHLVTLTFIGTQIVPSASITGWLDAGETTGTIQ